MISEVIPSLVKCFAKAAETHAPIHVETPPPAEAGAGSVVQDRVSIRGAGEVEAKTGASEKTPYGLLRSLMNDPQQTRVTRKAIHKGQKTGQEILSDAHVANPEHIIPEMVKPQDSEPVAVEKVMRNLLKFKHSEYLRAQKLHENDAEQTGQKLRDLQKIQKDFSAAGDTRPADAKLAVAHDEAVINAAHDLNLPVDSNKTDIAQLKTQIDQHLQTRIKVLGQRKQQSDELGKVFGKLAELRQKPSTAAFERIFGAEGKRLQDGMNHLNVAFLVLSIPSMCMMVGQWFPARKQPQAEDGSSQSLQNESPPLNPNSLRPRSIINAQAQQIQAQKAQEAQAASAPVMPLVQAQPNNVLSQSFTGIPAGYGAGPQSQSGGMY